MGIGNGNWVGNGTGFGIGIGNGIGNGTWAAALGGQRGFVAGKSRIGAAP